MLTRGIIFTAITLSGFSTLAAQVIFPRALHPYFGSSSDVGAAVVATALAGLALGYFLGGIKRPNPKVWMSACLAAGGASLLVAAAIWKNLDGIAGDGSTPRLLLSAAVLSFLPSITLGAVSPLAVRTLSQRNANRPSERPALIFGVGTMANVVGGLSSGYWLVPFVGLTRSLTGLGLLLFLTAVGLFFASIEEPESSEEPVEQVDDATTTSATSIWGLTALAFYSGIASVAIEVSGTRMLASNFGPTTTLWASVLSVGLGGLALGYFWGGRIDRSFLPTALWLVIAANSIWLLVSAWFLASLAQAAPTSSLSVLLSITITAFLPTFILFGMESQIIIGLVTDRSAGADVASVTGRIFAASTVGGLIGALSGVFFLLPVLGISQFVRIAVVGYLFVLAAAVLRKGTATTVIAAMTLIALVVPLPDWMWQNEPGVLLTQQEGRHQTIRIYTDETTYTRFHLGPTYESEVDFETGEPLFGYAETILERVDDVEGQNVLVIGGAGHALARAFETRGATVTEVEVDPLVAEVSNEFFGPIDGDVIIEDGRRFITNAQSDSFDIVVIDAFDGPSVVPPHITTAEFYEQVSRVLAEEGTMYINMIGETEGPTSGSFDVMSSTVASVFNDSGRDGTSGNIVLVASNDTVSSTLVPLEITTEPNTDDLNPMEIMTSRSG